MNRFSLATLTILAMILISPSARADLRDGLIGYWPFDGDGADASSFGRDLTLQGGVGFAPGLFRQALNLPGDETKFARRATNDAILGFGSGNFTIQAWGNWNSLTRTQVFVEKWTGPSGPGWTFEANATSLAFIASGLDETRSDFGLIKTNVWQHLVAVRRESTIALFLNSNLVARGNYGTNSLTDTSKGLLIGDTDGAQNHSVDGRIDEVAIWNRALSDAEIAYLYNSGLGNPVIFIPEPGTILLAALALIPVVARRSRKLSTLFPPRISGNKIERIAAAAAEDIIALKTKS